MKTIGFAVCGSFCTFKAVFEEIEKGAKKIPFYLRKVVKRLKKCMCYVLSEKDGLKVQDVLDEMGLSSETIVSKINGEIVIEESVIEDGDEVEFIQIIYGG